ncbi:MAG: hypothetical protein ACFBSF_09645 [Leptolyngbyaceae cyanobacterium]
MENAFRYWQLVQLDSSGRCHAQVIPAVQSWLATTFTDLFSHSELTDKQLQIALVGTYKDQQSAAKLAQLSLRCYISHQIRFVCTDLAQRFGEVHGFTAEDLFPIVLDDDGNPSPHHRPFSLDILEGYDPGKGQLSTWATRLVKTHTELDKVLINRGLYRATDWAILNDTSLTKLQRILTQYHLLSEAEVNAASQLLAQYHQVYRQDRIRQRQQGQRGGRCHPPTREQLQRMDPQRPAKVVLAQLQGLAHQLRQYCIHVRGGNPIPYGGDTIDWERFPSPQDSRPQGADDEIAFLNAYQQAIPQCLDAVLLHVIQAKMTKLHNRTPPRHQTYVKGLHLFHCEGMSIGKLAIQLGLSSQQAQRLLDLKRLRADTRHQLILAMQKQVQTEALNYVTADHLKQVDSAIEQYLTETVDTIIRDAAREAQIPKGRTAKSLFARHLCQVIHQLMEQ